MEWPDRAAARGALLIPPNLGAEEEAKTDLLLAGGLIFFFNLRIIFGDLQMFMPLKICPLHVANILVTMLGDQIEG